MKNILPAFFLSGILLAGSNFTPAMAQNPTDRPTIKMRLQTRMSYLWNEHEDGKPNCELLSLAIDGTLNKEFSFSAFQHFNRFNRVTDDNPLAATDWLYLRWRHRDFELSAGKQMVEYGGEEYDAAPIDIYGAGVYWNNFTSFTYSANAAYWLGKNKITLQVAQMPIADQKDDMAVSVSWRGKLGHYLPKHSVNVFGQGAGKPQLSSFVLGNIFEWDRARLYLDVINRWNDAKVKWFRDFSLVACATVKASEWMNVRVKYNYDYNKDLIDNLCPAGTHQSMYLTALEFFPLQTDKNVRLHLTYRYQNYSYLSAGITWRMHLLK